MEKSQFERYRAHKAPNVPSTFTHTTIQRNCLRLALTDALQLKHFGVCVITNRINKRACNMKRATSGCEIHFLDAVIDSSVVYFPDK